MYIDINELVVFILKFITKKLIAFTGVLGVPETACNTAHG